MFRNEYAQINGLRFHYAIAGEGQTMLFLHGFPEFWYEWRHLLVEFGRDYQVVAPDLRGYNLTEKPPHLADYSAKHLISDVRAMFDHFGHGRRGILVAHDWGGAVAWGFAIAYPEYLDGLIIINAPHPGIFARELAHNPGQQRGSRYMLTFRTPEAEEILSANGYEKLSRMIFNTAARPDVFTEDDRAQYLAAWAQPGALTGGLNFYRASRLAPPLPGMEAAAAALFTPLPAEKVTVNVPTLVIWGAKDLALLPGNLEGLDAYVPNLCVRRVPEGSHWVLHEEPELICREMREFLRQTKREV
jgi:pimeloyl-ACP methyl ester carboxylesterase